MADIDKGSRVRIILDIHLRVSQDYFGVETTEAAMEMAQQLLNRISSTAFYIPFSEERAFIRKPNKVVPRVQVFEYEGGPMSEYQRKEWL